MHEWEKEMADLQDKLEDAHNRIRDLEKELRKVTQDKDRFWVALDNILCETKDALGIED